jgi:hypothetical protein
MDIIDIDIILLIVKIAAIVFAFLHFAAVLFLIKQIKLAIRSIRTNTYKLIIQFAMLHAIILFVVLIIIILLPLS